MSGNKAELHERIAELLEAETRCIDRIHALEARLALYERAPQPADWRRHARAEFRSPSVRRVGPPEYWEWVLE